MSLPAVPEMPQGILYLTKHPGLMPVAENLSSMTAPAPPVEPARLLFDQTGQGTPSGSRSAANMVVALPLAFELHPKEHHNLGWETASPL